VNFNILYTKYRVCFYEAIKEAYMNPKTKAVTNSEQKKVPKKKKQHTPVIKFILMVTKILVIFFIAISFAIAGILGGAIVGYIKTATPITDDQMLKALMGHQTTFIYDMNEKEIGKLTGISENMDTILVKDSEIPKALKDAFIALEDERFEEHNGVDLIGFTRVVIKKMLNPSSSGGASTITMQLIKNITKENSVTIQRKVQEQWRAIQLEKKMQKWQILEAYLNIIPMGGNSYGVQSASLKYFGVPVNKLDIAQCATLAAITQLPNHYAPDTDEGKENNKVRQEICLKKMYEQGKITQNEYETAVAEDLSTKFVKKGEVKTEKQNVRSYFVDQVIKDVQKDLKLLGYSDQQSNLILFGGGLKIYTTMDPNVQGPMDEVYNDEKKYFPGAKNKKGEKPQSAMVIIDPKTGEVRAMIGGRGEKTGDSVLNRATQIGRSAGSSFKPIAEYGPAIDQRLYTAASVVDDVPAYMDSSKPTTRYPQDFPDSSGKRNYRGLTDIRTAIAKSINVVAAKVWMNLGPDLSFSYLKKSGINMETKGEGKVLSISLGGLRHGVNTMEMAAAYVPFVHKGMYYEPITYTQVKDSTGKIIIDRKKQDSVVKQRSNMVYEETTAFIMTDMLRSVTSTGTATYVKLKNSKKEAIPIAAKTGTTNDDKDRWFLGFTPSYVGAVWYGYDTQTEIKVKGNNPSAVIWNAVMQKIYNKSTEVGSFPQPEGIVKKVICIKSGKIPTDLCSQDPSGTSVIRNEYFIKGTEPKDDDFCDVHVPARVDTKSFDLFKRNLLANDSCPAADVVEKVFIRRKQPWARIMPDDPNPLDFMFEVPIEYCNAHGPGTVLNAPDITVQAP
jgi:penicillin-binding protein 1A